MIIIINKIMPLLPSALCSYARVSSFPNVFISEYLHVQSIVGHQWHAMFFTTALNLLLSQIKQTLSKNRIRFTIFFSTVCNIEADEV